MSEEQNAVAAAPPLVPKVIPPTPPEMQTLADHMWRIMCEEDGEAHAREFLDTLLKPVPYTDRAAHRAQSAAWDTLTRRLVRKK